MKRCKRFSRFAGKSTVLTLLSFMVLTWSATSAVADLPPLKRIEVRPISPADAQKVFDEKIQRLLALKLVRIASAAEATSEIQELARGLKNDPDLIYEYVYSKIEYTPNFGCIKGATATLVDGIGNDFDQASLLIALLRQAGYTANYVYGIIQLNAEQITNWLGIADNATAIGNLLWTAGIPATIYSNPDNTLNYVEMSHVWVKATIDGSEYAFDPSFKTHVNQSPIDLPSAMGYDRESFLSGALSGVTLGSDYVQNVNTSNIHSSLTTYATNLINYLKSNLPGESLNDVIGGKSIKPLERVPQQAALPYQQSVPEEWTEIPVQYKSSLRIEHGGIDVTLYSHELSGKRLTIFYNASNQPVLYLDGTIIATGFTAATTGASVGLTVTVDHAHSPFADDSVTRGLRAGEPVLLINGWGPTTRAMVERHRKLLKENIHASGDNNSEPVLGESLAMIIYTYFAEHTMNFELVSQLSGNTTIFRHILGTCSQGEGIVIDLFSIDVRVVNAENSFETQLASSAYAWGHGSSLEWGVMEQTQPYKGLSTVKLIDTANNQSNKIFDATSANYYSSVRPQLRNYGLFEIVNVDNWIDSGWRVILPEDGDLREGEWVGSCWLVGQTPFASGFGYYIQGTILGGHTAEPGPANPEEAAESGDSGDQSENHEQSSEPIDLVTGDYLNKHTDLTIGSGAYPFSLGFKRSYSSSSNLNDGPLGLGWTHNFDIAATLDSDGFQGMGEDSPIDAAAAVVVNYVGTDILKGNQNLERVVSATLMHKWYMDQLIDNIVTVGELGDSSKFVKLADGGYNPPPGRARTLSKGADDSYLLQKEHGVLLDFDAEGRIETWQDPNGNTVTFSYSDGKLQSVNNGMSRALTFTYNGDRISQISDGTGRNVACGYDATGNLTGVTNPSGHTTTYEYDIPGRLTKIYYPSRPSEPFVTNAYDSTGRVATQTDARGHTYNYHFAGSRAEEVDPLGHSKIWYFNDQGKTTREIDGLGYEKSYTYDGHNRLIKKIFPEGNSIEYEHDENHNITKRTANPEPGSIEPPIINLYTYESSFNHLKTYTDPLGRTTAFYYDNNGNLTRIDQPEVDSKIPKTIYSYNSRGQVETITDREGMITKYTYDAGTSNLNSTTIDQGGFNLTTQWGYDAVGNITGRTDPLGHNSTLLYDAMRRPVQITAPSPLNYVTKFTYDPDGNLTKLERETGDTQNPWQTTILTYSPTDRIETITNPEGHVTTYQYDQADRLWKMTDAESHTSQFLYDPLGRIYQVVDAQDGISGELTYTPNNRRESLKDGNGNITLYQYDGFERLERITYPDGSFMALNYDAVGNVIQKRTRSGDTITYGYDNLSRRTLKVLPGSNTAQYSYDLSGRLEEVIDSSGTFQRDYDTAGRLIRVTFPGNRTVQYEYDGASNLSKLIYPDGYFVTYTYDELNRLIEVLGGGTNVLAQYEYDPLSRRVALTYANGTSTSYTYEVDNDLASLVHQFAGSNVSLGYDYNNVGNRISFSSDDDRFVYTPSTSSQVEYVSNVLNQHTAVGGISYAYDGNGNLTSDGVNTYIYAANRLTQATTPQHAATYDYGYLGRRIAKTVDSVTTSYIYDGDQVIMEYDSAGQALRRYMYGPGIDQPVAIVTPTGEYYYHFDGLGSVIALSDSFGNLVETYAYSLYGKVDQESSVGNPYLYTGREYDHETGLYYYRARYYDPKLGRFLQVDPIGYTAGLNLYAYVGNNPTRYVDPYGLAEKSPEPEQPGQEPLPPRPPSDLPEPLDFTDPEVLKRDPALDRPPELTLEERLGPLGEIVQGVKDVLSNPIVQDLGAAAATTGLGEPQTNPRDKMGRMKGSIDAPGTEKFGVEFDFDELDFFQ